MQGMEVTAYQLAERFVGVKEVPGTKDNPAILAMLNLDAQWPSHDEVPWCSAFVNYIAWLLRLPRSKSLAARSWLNVGVPVLGPPEQPQAAFDVVILKRGGGDQPGPRTLDAPGHVGFYSKHENTGLATDRIWLLAGNQGNAVSVASFPLLLVLGVRRLWSPR